MTENVLSTPFLKEITERLEASIERAGTLASDLTPDQLNWKPAEDKWSVAQCFEHILNGADLYAEKLEPAIQRAANTQQAFAKHFAPRHTIMGRLILRAVEPTAARAMKSPKLFAPSSSDVSADILDRFVRSHETIAELISKCDNLDTNRIKYSSPVAAIIRLNATDGFAILVTHAERHLNQAERVCESANFPDA